MATEGTHKYLVDAGFNAELVSMNSVQDYVTSDKLSLIINTPTRGKVPSRDGFKLRRTAIEYNIPCITSLDTTNAMLSVLGRIITGAKADIYSLDEYSKY